MAHIHQVESTQILEVGRNVKTHTYLVRYKNGSLYEYYPGEMWMRDLCCQVAVSESVGKSVTALIKPYRYERIE